MIWWFSKIIYTMKKLVLVLVFVFATGTLVNANTKKDGVFKIQDDVPVPGCLLTAYNGANALENLSGVTWPLDVWTEVFQTLFDSCNKAEKGIVQA